jgi:hypothetical protein
VIVEAMNRRQDQWDHGAKPRHGPLILLNPLLGYCQLRRQSDTP